MVYLERRRWEEVGGWRNERTYRYTGLRPFGGKNLRGIMGPRVIVEAGLVVGFTAGFLIGFTVGFVTGMM